jgi:predicted DNA-binding transcriptional regulator AlpA
VRLAELGVATLLANCSGRRSWRVQDGYRKVQEGTFPSPIKLGSARASGWISGEVYAWIDEQIRRCRKV